MGAAAQAIQHCTGLGGVSGLAEDDAAMDDHGVGGKDNGVGVALRNLTRLGQGKRTRQGFRA
jgi:hypothetical protein